MVASGSTDTSVSFDLKVENIAIGSMVTLYALAAISPATRPQRTVTVTVVP